MNRKKFLQYTAAAAPFVIAFNSFSCKQRNFFQAFAPEINYRNRILVLIELIGGNDGLNTVIPIDKYNILSNARRDILIPEKKILPLHDSHTFGFHPSLTGLQSLYNDKLVTVIQGVGYPNPEFSHFRGKGIKYTANTEKDEIRTGWLGRYLERDYPNYPKGYPVKPNDGPAAIRIGAVSPKITQFMSQVNKGMEEDISIGFTKIDDFNASASLPESEMMSTTFADTNMDKIRAVSRQIKLYAPIIQDHANRQKNLSKRYPEPNKNPLADQLKTVARLIGSGLNTPVYLVSQGDYDTHADQVDKADTTQGKHASLLKDLSEAISAFEDDLHLMGKQDDVLGMTFSEFGRRIVSGSYGTDHGTSESAILFGTQLKNGIIGNSPELPSQVRSEDNLAMQYDFRSVYKAILGGWFGVPDERIKAIISQGANEKLELFKA